MSLNKLTSQDSPQPYLNGRVQNMRVDSTISTPSVITIGNASGAGTYPGVGFALTLGASPVCCSLNGISPGGNIGCAVGPTGMGLAQIASPYYLIDISVSVFALSTAIFTIYPGINGVPLTAYSSTSTIAVATARNIKLACVLKLTPSAYTPLEVYLLTSVPQNVTITSWNMTIQQLPNYVAT